MSAWFRSTRIGQLSKIDSSDSRRGSAASCLRAEADTPAAAYSGSMREFRILALDGGGARGIFQARLLQLVEEASGCHLADRFDMIAATSTGALVGLSLAAGLPAASIAQMYREHAEAIFRARPLGLLRRGGRYDQSALRRVLNDRLAERRLSGLGVRVVVAASVVDTYSGKLFTEEDDERMVDVALATTAAPTYFPPAKLPGGDRGYADGGLWANDPSFLAVTRAVNELGIDPTQVRVLSIGTGQVGHGRPQADVRGQRTLSRRTVPFIYDFISSLQAWQAQLLCARYVERNHMLRINPHLPAWIPLDDADRALASMPGIAESEYDSNAPELARFVSERNDAEIVEPAPAPALPSGLAAALTDAGVTRFHPSRHHYFIGREGRDSISAYVSLARRSLTMVSINLATGMDLEDVIKTFRLLVHRDPPVKIVISLLDPTKSYLMQSIAGVLGRSPDQLAQRINETIDGLTTFAEELDAEHRHCFDLWCHASIPNASAILIDADSDRALIQLETKAYKASFLESFGFEAKGGSEFFETLRASYERLIRDGRRVVPPPESDSGIH